MNADGSEQICVAFDPPDNSLNWGGGQPTWSPDGKKIAFVSFRDGNPEIYVMNADGSEQIRLTDDPTHVDWQPAWSP